jgi:Long-chain fatty acid transport protein
MKQLIVILLCSFTFIAAAKGPQYNSLRVRGMGGAFVAVADDKNALYYNPAGLNLINRFGNYEENPDMGYLPNKRIVLRTFCGGNKSKAAKQYNN